MRVLLTNDDGINAPGLRALYKALKDAGHEVFAVAPMRQQSGVSHCLTVFEPLRACKIADGDFSGTGIYGTPVDCVKLGLGSLIPFDPDLVIAGINQGPNSGPDIFYSGTVAAAAEGSKGGIPAMAVSHGSHEECLELDLVAAHVVALAKKINWNKIPPERVINVNYPPIPLAQTRGMRICRQSPAVWKNVYSERNDPRGEPYWWLTGDIDRNTLGENSDRILLEQGYITLTPLKFEYTDHEAMPILKDMRIEI